MKRRKTDPGTATYKKKRVKKNEAPKNDGIIAYLCSKKVQNDYITDHVYEPFVMHNKLTQHGFVVIKNAFGTGGGFEEAHTILNQFYNRYVPTEVCRGSSLFDHVKATENWSHDILMNSSKGILALKHVDPKSPAQHLTSPSSLKYTPMPVNATMALLGHRETQRAHACLLSVSNLFFGNEEDKGRRLCYGGGIQVRRSKLVRMQHFSNLTCQQRSARFLPATVVGPAEGEQRICFVPNSHTSRFRTLVAKELGKDFLLDECFNPKDEKTILNLLDAAQQLSPDDVVYVSEPRDLVIYDPRTIRFEATFDKDTGELTCGVCQNETTCERYDVSTFSPRVQAFDSIDDDDDEERKRDLAIEDEVASYASRGYVLDPRLVHGARYQAYYENLSPPELLRRKKKFIEKPRRIVRGERDRFVLGGKGPGSHRSPRWARLAGTTSARRLRPVDLYSHCRESLNTYTSAYPEVYCSECFQRRDKNKTELEGGCPCICSSSSSSGGKENCCEHHHPQ